MTGKSLIGKGKIVFSFFDPNAKDSDKKTRNKRFKQDEKKKTKHQNNGEDNIIQNPRKGDQPGQENI
jgi:hypothetical protein